MTPRVVLDTNVVVSALLDQRNIGRPSLCLRLALAGRLAWAASEELVEEYREVLVRPKFGFAAADVDALIGEIRRSATFVRPARLPEDVVADPDDASVLGTAVAARADYLVTGNSRDFPREHAGVVVVKPAGLLDRVRL